MQTLYRPYTRKNDALQCYPKKVIIEVTNKSVKNHRQIF